MEVRCLVKLFADRNECLFGSVCPNTARCENTPGSYRCLCDNGFELVGNNECRGKICLY